MERIIWKQLGAGHRSDLLNFLDAGTKNKYAYAPKSVDTLEVFAALNHIIGDNTIAHFYSDDFKLIEAAAKELRIPWQPACPGVHQTNGLIESCNRDIEMGTKAALFQAGMPACMWVWAAPLYCILENTFLEDARWDVPKPSF